MPEYIVTRRKTGEVVYAYQALEASEDDYPDYPFSQFNHTIKAIIQQPAPSRRLTKLDFIARIGDAAFSKLLELSLTSVDVLKFVKMIDWATPDPDGTSIDLDDTRVQKVRELEPILVSTGVVSAGWADEVLA